MHKLVTVGGQTLIGVVTNGKAGHADCNLNGGGVAMQSRALRSLATKTG